MTYFSHNLEHHVPGDNNVRLRESIELRQKLKIDDKFDTNFYFVSTKKVLLRHSICLIALYCTRDLFSVLLARSFCLARRK